MEPTDVMRWIKIYGLSIDKWEQFEPFGSGVVSPQEADNYASLESLDMTGEELWLHKVNCSILCQDFTTQQMDADGSPCHHEPAKIHFPPLPLPPRLRPLRNSSGSPLLPPADDVGPPPPMHFMSSSHDKYNDDTAAPCHYNHPLSFEVERQQYRLHHQGDVTQVANAGSFTCVAYASTLCALPSTPKRKRKSRRTGVLSRATATASHAKQSKTAGLNTLKPGRRAKTRDAVRADSPPACSDNAEQLLQQSSFVRSSDICPPENGIDALIRNIVRPSRSHLPPPPPLIHTSALQPPYVPTPDLRHAKLATPPLRSSPPLLMSASSPGIMTISYEPNLAEPLLSQDVDSQPCYDSVCDCIFTIPTRAESSAPSQGDNIILHDTTSHFISPSHPDATLEQSVATNPEAEDGYQPDTAASDNDQNGAEEGHISDVTADHTINYDGVDSASCGGDLGIADCTVSTDSSAGGDHTSSPSSHCVTPPSDSVTAAATPESTDEDEGFASDGNVGGDQVDKGTQCWSQGGLLWDSSADHNATCCFIPDACDDQSLSSVLEHTRKIIDIDCEVMWFVV